MMKKILLALALISTLAYAGLPPTTSKVIGDSNNVTTFNYQFPNSTGTHTGVTLSLGVINTVGGGTGTSTGHAILDLALTGGTMSGVLNMGGYGISSVLDPIGAQDAATKNYVDTVASAYLLKSNNLSDVLSVPTAFDNIVLANTVTNAKLAQAGASTLKGNNAAATANEQDLTVAQVNAMLGNILSVLAGNGLTVSGSSTTTVSLANTAVTPGSYTSTNLTVDAQGRITAASNGGGTAASTIEASFTLSDAVTPYLNIDGSHRQVNTMTLSLVHLSMLESGNAGAVNPILTVPGASTGFSTVLRINQYKPGTSTVFATGCAAIPGNKTINSGGPNSVAATVSSCTTWAAAPMSLAIGDITSVDVISVGPSTVPYGVTDSVTLQY